MQEVPQAPAPKTKRAKTKQESKEVKTVTNKF
jgi:hypothetical protein